MKSITKAVYIILLVAVSSCNTTKSNNFDWGYVIDGNYQNKFFGIDWPIPENWDYDDTYAQLWTKANNMEIQRLAESSYESKMRIKMLPEQVKESVVFRLSKFKPETAGNNPTIIVYTENFATMDGANVQDMEDYVAESIKQVGDNPQMTLDSEDYETDRIGGTKFYKLTASVKDNDRTVLQHYYSTEINGFGLTFILSSTDKGGLAELEEVFRTITF
jgi:hypothetical protein